MRGRIRTIKPEVHSDEVLWDLEVRTGFPLFRLFTGLWCHADREGRFEWRPRALKAAILPYWEGDAFAALEALVGNGFVIRYEVEGRQYGIVRAFKKHQIVNNREEPSKLPPPPVDACCTREGRVIDPCLTGAPHRESRVGHAPSGERNGTERKGTEHLLTCAGAESTDRAGLEPEPEIFSARLEGEPEADGPTAEQIQVRFRALHMNRFRVDPYMGGESVRTFPERLRTTARLLGRDPLELLAEVYGRWRPDREDKISRNAPYAAFAARFGSLCETPGGANGQTDLERLQTEQIDALGRGDHERYRSLVAEEKRRRGEQA